MDQDQLKKDDEDTTNIFLEFVELEVEASDKSGKKAEPHSGLESVEKAKELLQLRGACKQLQSTEVVVTETESEGFVVISAEPAPASTACQNKHLAATCGGPATSVKRPHTLALQPAADPGDPPLFSPCQSCPPPRRMPSATQSEPALTCTPRNCYQQSGATAAAMVPLDNKQRAKIIAERLKVIGDDYESKKKIQNFEEDLSGLIRTFARPTSAFSLLCYVTRIFRGLYEILSLLKSKFGERNPPDNDERWQLFLKTLDLLRNDIVPLISSRGGWGAFLRASLSEVCEVQGASPRTDILGSPLLSRNITTCSSPHSLPKTHSTPILPQCEQRTPNSRLVTTPSCRIMQEYQPSPGSTRSLRMNRCHTHPARSETHPRKLWSLSESGSLVDEDGNDDFEESLKSDLEGSTISLEKAGKMVPSTSQLSDSENEKDDLVFPMQTDEGQTTTPCHHSASSPAVIVVPHQEEAGERESLYDSGIISPLDTLSLSSTPPRDVSFALGNTPLVSLHTDSAVDVSGPKTPKGEKKRPKSGCSFSKPKEVSPFDRARSMSVPGPGASKRKEKPFTGLSKKSSRKSSAVVVSSSPPCERSYNSGSLSLSSISEEVLYEAVCSLLR